jgi:hypothetical protein
VSLYDESMSRDAVPGSELVEQGLDDLRQGRETDASLVVSIGASRLRAAGCDVAEPLADPEHRLFARLAGEDADSAHGRYNAMIRRLVSYERAAECVAP